MIQKLLNFCLRYRIHTFLVLFSTHIYCFYKNLIFLLEHVYYISMFILVPVTIPKSIVPVHRLVIMSFPILNTKPLYLPSLVQSNVQANYPIWEAKTAESTKTNTETKEVLHVCFNHWFYLFFPMELGTESTS